MHFSMDILYPLKADVLLKQMYFIVKPLQNDKRSKTITKPEQQKKKKLQQAADKQTNEICFSL